MCGKKYTTRIAMCEHYRTHTGDPPYKCSVCRKPFFYRSSHRRHFRTHQTETPYKCNLCGGCYSDSYSLKTHMERHGERSHKCDVCGQMFYQLQNLKRHKMKHTREKPFNCDECGRKFARKRHLQVHENTHKSVTPFQCETCLKYFVNSAILKRHKFGHDESNQANRPVCEICNKKFSTRSNLLAHMRRIHQRNEPSIPPSSISSRTNDLISSSMPEKPLSLPQSPLPPQSPPSLALISALPSFAEIPSAHSPSSHPERDHISLPDPDPSPPFEDGEDSLLVPPTDSILLPEPEENGDSYPNTGL